MTRPTFHHGDSVELTIGGPGAPPPRVGVYVRSGKGGMSVVDFDGSIEEVTTSYLVPVPNAAEIEAACEAIRRKMTAYERFKRSGGLDGANHDEPYETPHVSAEVVRSSAIEARQHSGE